VTSLAIILASLGASALVYRALRKRFHQTWKRLSPAVPDTKALEGQPYRQGDDGDDGTDLMANSRKALALLPRTRRARALQATVALAASPALAAIFAVAPIIALGPWSALVGALLGLGYGTSLLMDQRKVAVLLAIVSFPLLLASPVAAGASVLWFALYRFALDRKDAAGKDEAERERLADPRYLSMSRLGRAAGIARSRAFSSGACITDASAQENVRAT
jgi:hypothetical protein